MAENIEFIAAKDLPITEAKEVNVLCVDNGELKLKEAANLGGSSGGYVIKELQISNMNGSGLQVIVTENYDKIAEILNNGGSVWLDAGALGYVGGAEVIMWGYAPSDKSLELYAMMFQSGSIILITANCPNGTWTPPEA